MATGTRYGEAELVTYRGVHRSTSAVSSEGSDSIAALEFVSGLARELSRGPVELPCFPNAILKIQSALKDPKATAVDACRLIRGEPRLAARVLQLANSAAIGTSGRRISDLRSAITRLGFQTVQAAAIAYATRQMGQEPRLNLISQPLHSLWVDSIRVATVAEALAIPTRVSADEAFLAGLLHGIGRLFILVHGALKLQSIESLSPEIVDSWHPQIGKALLENWNIPEAVAQAVGDQVYYDRGWRHEADLTDIVIASVYLGAQVTGGEVLPATPELSSFKTLRLSIPTCELAIEAAHSRQKALLDLFAGE